jgi:hypothetical protein
MSDKKDRIESILDHVQPARRTFLKRLLGGSALALLAVPASSVLAQDRGQGDGDGKGKGKGQGKGKGKGKGNGKGKGKGEGKGKGNDE